ncbi:MULTISPECIES: hypothetical protein [Deefgea]|uniref:Uncharacterized protein n=1 Tax=Deefgea chitinilytica TaxID=570276 RepID=A0ABS2CBA5_9NEIS|nr:MULTISPECIES: hypothetical protein [Deefgea]MBM5571428.1 hypothetical protein [Deefgea chitinilytica]MBM9888661.1 hypothetical protein [Deefgea sp. CFH1-16]
MNSIPTSILKTIFRKTSAGNQEILTRQLGLSAKERRVLILIDGDKSVSALNKVVLEVDLLPAIIKLQALELIHSSQNQQLEQAQVENDPIDTIEQQRDEPVKTDSTLDFARFNAIKALMIDSSETLLGVFGKPLVEKIKVLHDESELSNTITQWNLSLRESKKGQQHAEQYLEAIKTLMK